jgi:hypothetical protein
MPWREGFCTLARGLYNGSPTSAAGCGLQSGGRPLVTAGLSLAFGRWSRPGGL